MDKPFPAYQGDEPYVFVCYAHEDEDVVYPELAWLHEQGIKLWYDEGISGGKIVDQLSNWCEIAAPKGFVLEPGAIWTVTAESSDLDLQHC